jgi:hypothetical protein
MARRHRLLPPNAADRWFGEIATLRTIADSALRQHRPLAVAAAVPDSVRAAIGGQWTLTGVAWVRASAVDGPSRIDSVATSRVATLVSRVTQAPLRVGFDGTAEWAQRLLRCPARALGSPIEATAASLDATCNSK